MAANIFGERFLGNREPAWHGLGTTFTDPMTAVDAFKSAQLDYVVEKEPLQLPDGTPWEDHFAIVRQPVPDDPVKRIFGAVGKDYGIMQNMVLAEAADLLTGDWPVETVGALGRGETVFLTLDAGEINIGKKELLHQYFLVCDFKTGGSAAKIAFTPVRVVCQNTLVSGLHRATVSANLEHFSNISDVFKFRMELLGKLQKAKATTLDIFSKLATTAITVQDSASIIAAAYPYPEKPAKAAMLDGVVKDELEIMGELVGEATKSYQAYEYVIGRLNVFRAGAQTCLDRINDEYPNIANTAWAAWNAVVETADYRDGTDTVKQQALFGIRAKEKVRAFDMAMTFIK